MSGQSPPQWPPGQQPQLFPQQYPPQYPPQQMWYPPIQQPPSSDSKTVTIIVIVVILIVIVPAVLGSILYVMVSGLLGGEYPADNTPPYISFGSITPGGSATNRTATWAVAAVSEPISAFSSFRVQVMKDSAPLSDIAPILQAGGIITFGSSEVKLKVRDIAGEGKLTGGDTFLVYGMDIGHAWRFSLIWGAYGSELAQRSWST